jgi:Tol biopolymer transport system component
VKVQHFAPVMQFSSDARLTFAPTISHGGTELAFSSDREGPGGLAIWTKPMGSKKLRRVTSGEFNDLDPDFSPYDHLIAFRSERDGGGVYIVPSDGSDAPRLIARGGWKPKFSPDGKWIAYFTLTEYEDSTASFGLGQIFIVSSEGGQPRRIATDFPTARYPIWAPDSAHILFSGARKDGERDWWTAPIDGGPPARTHALELLNRSLAVVGYPENWQGDAVFFSGAEDRDLHVWEIPISSSSMQALGPPRRLTNGGGTEQQSAVGPDGRLFFATLKTAVDVWSLPVDPGNARVLGPLRQVTHDGLKVELPTVSADGSKLAYISNKSGQQDIWVGDPDGKSDQRVTSARHIGYRPLLSPDGNRLIYPTILKGECAVQMLNLAMSAVSARLGGCYGIWDWSPDGSSLLTFRSGVTTEVNLTTVTGERQTILSSKNRGLFGARFSPDGHWIAFTVGGNSANAQIYIAPLKQGTLIPESEWILVCPNRGGEPAWSPGGDVLYFFSKRDGYHCIWAQKLGPGKRPEGEPIPIQHLHSPAFGMFFMRITEFGLSVTKDRLTMNLAQSTGNLWTMLIPADEREDGARSAESR